MLELTIGLIISFAVVKIIMLDLEIELSGESVRNLTNTQKTQSDGMSEIKSYISSHTGIVQSMFHTIGWVTRTATNHHASLAMFLSGSHCR